MNAYDLLLLNLLISLRFSVNTSYQVKEIPSIVSVLFFFLILNGYKILPTDFSASFEMILFSSFNILI